MQNYFVVVTCLSWLSTSFSLRQIIQSKCLLW